MTRATCTRAFSIDCAHRVTRHESKCAHLHGHTYKIEIECEAGRLDSVGRVVDFSVIKDRVGGFLEAEWDHGMLVNREDQMFYPAVVAFKQKHFVFEGEPTAENMALFLLGKAQELLQGTGVDVIQVIVHETPNCKASARRSG